jgi:hypothetical protein
MSKDRKSKDCVSSPTAYWMKKKRRRDGTMEDALLDACDQ